ncbi:MAG: cytochrome c peroxidase [Woeseiaceae bacterium]
MLFNHKKNAAQLPLRPRKRSLVVLSLASAGLLISGCSSNNDAVDTTALLALVTGEGMTGDPTTGRTLPAITDPKAVLGKKLFFSKNLGGDVDSACVTCHHPTLGGGDNLSFPIGVGAEAPDLLGVGRVHSQTAVGGVFDGGPTVPRNAPTTFNLAMWDQALFHDGRIESIGKTAGKNGNDGLGLSTPDSGFNTPDPLAGVTLASAQARFPVTSPEEMRGFFDVINKDTAVDRTRIEAKLNNVAAWGAEFALAYAGNTNVTYEKIAEAIGEYERSQVFVDTPWKAFVGGDVTAISESAKRGAVKFFGDANCSSCHKGDFYTDELYHVMAAPQIGRGKGDNNGTLSNDDFGRMRVTKDAADKYKFRTPTLLNVEVTGPWGHAGGYTTLEGMVRHMLDPEKAMASYNPGQLEATVQASNVLTNTQFHLDQLVANRANGVAGVHQVVGFTGEDVKDLVAFLKTLTDPCVKDRACLAPWIPDTNNLGPDGLQLNATDSSGALL